MEPQTTDHDLRVMRSLSPRRKSTSATDIESLAAEQLAHYHIDPNTDYGRALSSLVGRLYACGADLDHLWRITAQTIDSLDRSDRVAYFNAKKFLAFQIAKLLDNLMNPLRRTYQSLDFSLSTQTAKGPYAMFDNVTAIFSATPVIARTATYVYACAEWVAEAFEGREFLEQIYSRLLNPTSLALANYIVDLEAGQYARDYLAWNFNSGMAAIDAALAHILGQGDLLVTARSIYGGAHQLIYDWYAKPANLGVVVETFNGHTAADFAAAWSQIELRHADRLSADSPEQRHAYVYLESPSNPHGYVLDVPGICKFAHQHGMRVLLDATVGTPFLSRPLRRDDPEERPDFVIHSYTKDLTGTGSAIAGVVIGRNEDMFIPKGQTVAGRSWQQSLFWNVYYIKGAFLNADAAYEVLQGIRTLDVRMLHKCINTLILAKFLASHPDIGVNCAGLDSDPNRALCRDQMFLGLPAPLFTIDMPTLSRQTFQRFFDSLDPTFAHMISLGQANTIVSCPGLTTHSELDEKAQAEADITPSTIRFAVGDEDPRDLLAHLHASARACVDPEVPGFSSRWMSLKESDRLIRDCYLDVHRRYIDSKTASRE
ncbi:MAG TPA: aminotransferase class I/II-fold pyridoxal phosphate-dependent enzyme [Terracidiphilus sp.]|jgi:O-acetylhomoserine/O-acetylserine sulfhydrylase-like pyridoxal-dependent enzyme|nr:aminotransferase class I/II-fold pyridoxal phosphate-dependent enzyme [Terracidiphilus sp.]